MGNLSEERSYKIERILEEYDKRKTQKEVAEMFGMDIKHVSLVTQKNNYRKTRKITQENRRENEIIDVLTDLNEYEFLDQYSIERFKK